MLQPSLKGRLLVATPVLFDPRFDRTVVLVLEHSEEGAVGVIVNRPSDLDLLGSLPGWSSAAAEPAVVFVGGPVAQGAAICLGRAPAHEPPSGWDPVVDGVGIVDLSLDAAEVLHAVDQVRVFTGYAGWGAGQLEGEIEVGAWVVVDAEPGDAFAAEPGTLWRRVLRRQRGRLAWLANFPVDPSLN